MAPEALELLCCLRAGDEVDLEEVEAILDENRSVVNTREPAFGWTPLLFAAHIGNAKLMNLLLKAKADVNAACKEGNSALHLAARRGHLNESALLHSQGIDIEIKNMQGWTPLIWASIAGCTSVACTLLDLAADPSIADAAGRTACMWAARHGHTDILRILLSKGTDLSLRDQEGYTVQDHANHYAEMQSLICPSTVDTGDEQPTTPLGRTR
jgi:ankyrin repeat protein